jgi:hypothetical protein
MKVKGPIVWGLIIGAILGVILWGYTFYRDKSWEQILWTQEYQDLVAFAFVGCLAGGIVGAFVLGRKGKA